MLAGELLERGGGRGLAEQAFGVKTTSGLAFLISALAPEQVEVLRRGGRIGDPHRSFGSQLEEPFHAGARVLQAGSLVAVRQQHREA